MYVCMYLGSRTISLEEKCLPTVIQALNLTQTLTLTGGEGNVPWGQLSGDHLFILGNHYKIYFS